MLYIYPASISTLASPQSKHKRKTLHIHHVLIKTAKCRSPRVRIYAETLYQKFLGVHLRLACITHLQLQGQPLLPRHFMYHRRWPKLRCLAQVFAISLMDIMHPQLVNIMPYMARKSIR